MTTFNERLKARRNERPMTKREFVMQYALNRALGHGGGLEGEAAVSQGLIAWDYIERKCK